MKPLLIFGSAVFVFLLIGAFSYAELSGQIDILPDVSADEKELTAEEQNQILMRLLSMSNITDGVDFQNKTLLVDVVSYDGASFDIGAKDAQLIYLLGLNNITYDMDYEEKKIIVEVNEYDRVEQEEVKYPVILNEKCFEKDSRTYCYRWIYDLVEITKS